MTEIKDSPTVSVIIATYNRAHLVGRAIRSVFNQTYQDFELIVVDDGSTDDTEQVIKGFSDDRLRYIQLGERSGGAAFPRNTGLKTARGEYIAILDSDDTWLDKDKLKEQVEFLDAHPDYVLVGTNSVVVDESGHELTRSLSPERDEEIRGRLLTQNCFCHSSVMYRKWAVMIFGGYKPVKRTPSLSDYGLWLQLGTVGKFANLPIYGVNYTTWSGNISTKNRMKFCLHTIKLISKYKDKYPNYWRAISCRSVGVFNTLLYVISDLRTFLGLKEFLKSRCPACWRAIKFSHRIILQGILQSILGISYLLNRLHNRRLERAHKKT